MLKIKHLSLLDAKSDQIECPPILVQKSQLLRNISNINDGTSQPLPIPAFITMQVIRDIIKTLEDGNYNSIINGNIEYLLTIQKTLNFLDIHDDSRMLISSINDRITFLNCFQVFKMTNGLPCMYQITEKSVSVMLSVIEEYYSETVLSEDNLDPYVNQYSSMTISEIDSIISSCDKYLTVVRIMILKNWLSKNDICANTETILKLINLINNEACYIPRSEIQFMRSVRDSIYDEIRRVAQFTYMCEF